MSIDSVNMMKSLTAGGLKGKGGGGGCFAKGTAIATPLGDVPIESVKVGDEVYCFDDRGNTLVRKVLAVFEHDGEAIYKYNLWGDITLLATENHWVLNQYNTFAQIGTFSPDDMLIDARGHMRHILSSEFYRDGKVYNFHVEQYRTFFANGIRVHNGGISLVNPMLRGKGGGGGGSKGGGGDFYEAPNDLASTTTARLLELISAGPIQGLVNGGQAVNFDGTPLLNESGDANFGGITWDFRNGEGVQSVIPGHETVRTEIAVASPVEYGLPVVRKIIEDGIKAIAVKIQFPQGLVFQDINNSSMVGTSVSLQVHISYDNGPYIHVMDLNVSGKNTSAFERSWYIPIQTASEFDVKVTRLTSDATQSDIQNATTFNSITLYGGHTLSYPYQALMSYTVNAKEFGNTLPERLIDVEGLIVDVPSNYDPVRRTYSGIWDGTFKKAYTNNGAWFLWWMLTNPVYGLGGLVDDYALDVAKSQLYNIAKYNDELVEDGYGGMEPRFTFNMWMTERKNPFELLREVAGTMRTLVFWADSGVYFSQDRPQSKARVFSPANVIKGEFTYSETPLSTRHSMALVAYQDHDNFGETAFEPYEDPDLMHLYGIKKLEVALIGCTSRGQAHRAAKYAVTTEKLETRLISFSVGLENIGARVGDVIGVADPNFSGLSFGGRVKSYLSGRITLDRVFEFSPTDVYNLLVMQADGKLLTAPIINPGVATDEIIISLENPTDILPNAVWSITSTSLVPQEYRIMSIIESEPTIYQIEAVQYDSRKYDFVEKDLLLPAPPTSNVPSGAIPPPFNLNVFEYLYRQSNGTVLGAMIFGWTEPEDPRVMYYEVMIQAPSDLDYVPYGVINTPSLDVKDTERGVYRFKVRSVSGLGQKSVWVEYQTMVHSLEQPLPDVTGFTTVYIGGKLHLAWDEIDDIRDYYYEIRMGSASWSGAVYLGKTTELVYPIQGETIYCIKARYLNAESVNPATLEVEFTSGTGIVQNVIATIDERADNWDGISISPDWRIDKSNNFLYLDSSSNTFWGIEDFWRVDDFWSFDYTGETGYYTHMEHKEILLAANNVAGVSFLCNYYGTSRNEDFWAIDDFWLVEDFWGIVADKCKVERQIKVRKDGAWGDWQNYHDTSDYIGDGYRFRVKGTSDPNILLYITDFKVSIDVPDNFQNFKNLFVPAEGVSVVFNPPYNKEPNIVGTIIDVTGQEDFYFGDSDITTHGATIRVRDKNGNGVEKHINLMVQGY